MNTFHTARNNYAVSLTSEVLPGTTVLYSEQQDFCSEQMHCIVSIPYTSPNNFSPEQLCCKLKTRNTFFLYREHPFTARNNYAVYLPPWILTRTTVLYPEHTKYCLKQLCCVLNTRNAANSACVVSWTSCILPGSTMQFPENQDY